MQNVNARILSVVVGGLSGTAYFAIGILLFRNYLYNPSDEYLHDDLLLSSVFVTLIFCVVAVSLTLLFLRGAQKKHLGFMTPFVYMTAGGIIFSVISIMCIYNADLATARTSVNPMLAHFYYCLGFGIYILFVSPIFLNYQQMRKLAVQNEQETPNVVTNQGN